MTEINMTESLKMEYLKLVKEIWIAEFGLARIPPPQLEIEFVKNVKDLAHRILLSCYMPSSLIWEDSSEQIIEYFPYPINLFNHFKSSLKNKLPSSIGKFINIKFKGIPIKRHKVINKIGVHPSYFNMKHSLSKIYYIR